MKKNVNARFIVIVEAETFEQCEQVMAERLGPDEDYGFNYALTFRFEDAIEREPSDPAERWVNPMGDD